MKKRIIIILIVLVLIGSTAAGGYFAYKRYKEQDPFEKEWVRIYYAYMKENNEIVKKKQETLKYYRESEKIQFCKIEDIEKPVMLYNYKELGETFTNVFYINENNTVNMLQSFKSNLKVEYLYNIEEKKYDYYIHEINGSEEKYSKISESIKANKINENKKEGDTISEINIEKVITIKTGEMNSVTTLDGDTLEILVFDQTFIKTTVVEENWEDINFNSYEEGIKKVFSIAIKQMEKELSNQEKEELLQKEEEIEIKKEAITKAIEEIEKKNQEEKIKAEEEAKKKAEEEKIKAEEEAKKKIEEEAKRVEEEKKKQEEARVGNYTLKYGTYKGIDCWTVNDPLSKYETTITLNSDGTYTQTNLITVAGMTENYSGKFSISYDENSVMIITLSANDAWYKVTGNNQFTSATGSIIKYEEN